MSRSLAVVGLNLYELQNAEKHHTSLFELVHLEPPTAVLRRGQAFAMNLEFDRAFDDENDTIQILFNFGSKVNSIKTQAVGVINSKAAPICPSVWDANVVEVTDNNLIVEVKVPEFSPVGQWNIVVLTSTVENPSERVPYHHNASFYLLFNPWNKDDSVYMEDESLLNEYVLNDVGKIWKGTADNCTGREWLFGQFDAKVLQACMLMFEKSYLNPENRGDPVLVARNISNMLSYTLYGRWSDDYTGGTDPSCWTGSVPILGKYLEMGGDEPVKFGQCWVFAGVITTICRALGLPSRVVTNFESAHDTNGSLSIDQYFDSQMNPLGIDPFAKEKNKQDRIWNFHVWSEVWMSRPELPRGYGGWQAIDGTPQEMSGGLYQCGPASVNAVKHGAAGFLYDIGFLVATVNADIVNWRQNNDYGFTKVQGDTRAIGRMILTKKPFEFDVNGDSDREDITDSYKAREGDDEERFSLYRAAKQNATSSNVYAIPNPAYDDIAFEILKLDRVFIGDPIDVTVRVTNKCDEGRHVTVKLSTESVYYNGLPGNLIKNVENEFTMNPCESEELTLSVTDDEYLGKLVEYSIVKILAIAIVKDTNQTWVSEKDFQIMKPSLTVQVDEGATVGNYAKIHFTFQNPLKVPLTNCEFHYAGTGISNDKKECRDIEPFEDVNIEYELIFEKVGNQKLIAIFNSREMDGITGSVDVNVSA